MAIAVYPGSVIPYPERATYQIAPKERVQRTVPTNGPSHQREMYVENPTVVELTFLFDLSQFEIFSAWFHYKVDDGWGWILFNTDFGFIPVDRGLQYLYCHPIDSYSGVLVGPTTWRITLVAELHHRYTAGP